MLCGPAATTPLRLTHARSRSRRITTCASAASPDQRPPPRLLHTLVAAPWAPLAAGSVGALGVAALLASPLLKVQRGRLAPSLPPLPSLVDNASLLPPTSPHHHVRKANVTAPLEWVVISPHHAAEKTLCTRSELSKRFSLPPRDVRLLLDTPGAHSHRTALLPREKALVLLLRPSARCVLSASEAYIPAQDRAFANNVSSHLALADASDGRPFELRVLDAALESECEHMEAEAASLETHARVVLEQLTARVSSAHLEHARVMKGAVGRGLGAATALRGEVARLLDDDSDLRSLNLSMAAPRTCGAPEDADVQDIEDLLETYHSLLDGVVARLKLVDEALEDTEQFISRDLDAKRNLVLGINLVFSASSFTERVWGGIAKALRPSTGGGEKSGKVDED